MGHVQQPLGHSKVTTYRTDHETSGNDTGCNATTYPQGDAPSIPAEAWEVKRRNQDQASLCIHVAGMELHHPDNLFE